MKLNIKAYASAQSVAAAILYVACSFLIVFSPEKAARLAGYVFHVDLSRMIRPFSVSGFVVGFLVISIGWGLLSLNTASVYNSLTKKLRQIQPNKEHEQIQRIARGNNQIALGQSVNLRT